MANWNALTEEEKLEELRRDSLKTMEYFNILRKEHDALSADHQNLKVLTNEALKEVDRLKKELGR